MSRSRIALSSFRIYINIWKARWESLYTAIVEIEFDPAKDVANLEKHGVSLAQVAKLEIVAVTDNSRPEEEELRFRIYGFLGGEACCAVVTWREGRARAISLRRANRMERKRYELQARD